MSLLPLRFGGATALTVASTFPHKLSPALADGMVARRRLFKRMEAVSKAGVIAIVGPPASGKTFLAASWLCFDWVVQRTGRAIWYQADAMPTRTSRPSSSSLDQPSRNSSATMRNPSPPIPRKLSLN